MKAQIVNNSVSTECFSLNYPLINNHLINLGDFVPSRNGDTKEILNFKTEITNPLKRCVGNNGRNINIFFLIAEALWIFRGRKDVDFLTIFNSRMSDYSDDGVNFHAPYGFRLRKYGISSFEKELKPLGEEQNHGACQANSGIDQIREILLELTSDPESRRAVMSIWNPELDLRKKSKDIPCNDLVMYKIRNNKLHTTIANRSNDLHWGLPTNVFQFSFVSEIISNILGTEIGSQVHNSQSLHFYMDNPIAMDMYESSNLNPNYVDLYDVSNPTKIDMNFSTNSVESRLDFVDNVIDAIINSILSGERLKDTEELAISEFSNFLYVSYRMLWCYKKWKESKKIPSTKAFEAYHEIKNYFSDFSPNSDIETLALNFFAKRGNISDEKNELIGRL